MIMYKKLGFACVHALMSDPTAFADAIQQWNDLFSFGQRFRMNQAAWMRDQRRSGRPNAELWRNVESNGWLCSKQPTTPDDIVGTNSCELETAYRAAGSRLSMSEARFAVLLAAVDWMPEHDWKSLGLTYDCGPSFKRIGLENDGYEWMHLLSDALQMLRRPDAAKLQVELGQELPAGIA